MKAVVSPKVPLEDDQNVRMRKIATDSLHHSHRACTPKIVTLNCPRLQSVRIIYTLLSAVSHGSILPILLTSPPVPSDLKR